MRSVLGVVVAERGAVPVPVHPGVALRKAAAQPVAVRAGVVGLALAHGSTSSLRCPTAVVGHAGIVRLRYDRSDNPMVLTCVKIWG